MFFEMHIMFFEMPRWLLEFIYDYDYLQCNGTWSCLTKHLTVSQNQSISKMLITCLQIVLKVRV